MNESTAKEKEPTGRQAPPLKTLEDMLYNRITKRKAEIHDPEQSGHNRQIEFGQRYIETLQWVLAQNLSVRKRLGHERYYY
jgi:hypothetical protein